MITRTEAFKHVKSLGTAFSIIELLQERDGAQVTEIADELDLAKSTVSNHLATLEAHEYVVREGDTYLVGLKFLDHGRYAKDRQQVLNVTPPRLEQLASETGELIWLVVEEHGRAVYLHKAAGDQGVQTRESVGSRGYMHCIASGKAILAHLPESYVEQVIERHGLPELTPQTTTDAHDLSEELETVRDEGVAFNRQEEVVGVRAVAAPITVNDGVYGSVCVTGPAERLKGDQFTQRLPNLVMGAANDIELRLKYME